MGAKSSLRGTGKGELLRIGVRATRRKVARTPKSIMRSAQLLWRSLYRLGQRLRRRQRRYLKLLARRRDQLSGYWDLGYRPAGEIDRCPACRGPGVRHLDVLSMRGKNDGPRVGFMSGCASCGLLFANPPPTTEQLSEFYSPHGTWATAREEKCDDREARSKVSWRLRAIFGATSAGLDLLEPRPGSRALDFGCGNGTFLDSLKACGWETYGIDPAVKTAFPRHRELSAPPEAPTFRLVVVNHVLEHLASPLEALRRLSACMLEGGLLYASIPRLDGLPQHGDLRYCINSQVHPVSYSRDCLVGLLAAVSLETVAVLDSAELDQVLTAGRPLRLRLLARKVASVGPSPPRPLRAARRALGMYRWRFQPLWNASRFLPVRLRASWVEARKISDMRRRKEPTARTVGPE